MDADVARVFELASPHGPAQFRKKPVVVRAVQLTWQSWQEVCEFLGPEFRSLRAVGGVLVTVMASGDKTYAWGDAATDHVASNSPIALRLKTAADDWLVADENDWIIRGTAGEVYPCKPDIFDTIYERVREAA